MAVFAWYLGNPFDQPQDDQVFYDAVSDVSSDVFHYAADRRLWSQTVMYDALTYRTYDVRRWITYGDTDPTYDQWFEFGIIVSLVAIVTIGPYLNPWTVVPVLVLDAFNIYRYFD